MIAFGIFLLLVVGITAGFALASGDDPATLSLLGFDLETTDRGIFVAGAWFAVGVFISYRLIVVGWRRMLARRRELQELRESVNQTTERLHELPERLPERVPKVRSHRRSREGDSDDGADDRDHFDSAPRD